MLCQYLPLRRVAAEGVPLGVTGRTGWRITETEVDFERINLAKNVKRGRSGVAGLNSSTL